MNSNCNIDKETEKSIAEAIKKDLISESSFCKDKTSVINNSAKEVETIITDAIGEDLIRKTIIEKVTPRNHIGRNQDCPCGSNKKYKKCCLLKKEYTLGH